MLTLDLEKRKLLGVAAGVARYCKFDPLLVRVLFVIGTVLSVGTGVLVYLVLWFLMPKDVDDNIALGVCRRLNAKFGVSQDPVWARMIAMMLISCSVGVGILVYFLIWAMLPRDTRAD